MTTVLSIAAFEAITRQNRNGWIAFESAVPVRQGTSEEEAAPLRRLFELESTARAKPNSIQYRI